MSKKNGLHVTRRTAALMLGAAAFSVTGAQAQAWPSKPIRVIVPFGAGGVADVTVRLVTERLADKVGQRFVIENQPGPGGIAAARSVLSAGADGHTLALFSNGTAVSVNMFKDLRFDPLKDFAPISTLGFFDFVLATSANSKYRTLKDLIDYGKANPGKLNVGLLIDSYSALKSLIDDKQVRALASSGPTRSPVTPDLPTAQEAGVPGYDVTSWNALFAPAGTPADVIDKLQKGLAEVLAEPEMKRRLLELGIEARSTQPQQLKTQLEADIAKWEAVITKAGIPKN